MRKQQILPPIRFLQQAETQGLNPDVCWEWQGQTNNNGYGRFIEKNKHRLAHRVAHELFIGPIPNGKNVCHACDNRRCVNPHHLWAGTQSENLNDAVAKGRLDTPNTTGELNGNRKLSATDVRIIREMKAAGQLQYKIAEKFGVSPSTIGEIVAGKIWKDAA